jgi:hypothetical protein
MSASCHIFYVYLRKTWIISCLRLTAMLGNGYFIRSHRPPFSPVLLLSTKPGTLLISVHDSCILSLLGRRTTIKSTLHQQRTLSIDQKARNYVVS